jgi:hypothetical protein
MPSVEAFGHREESFRTDSRYLWPLATPLVLLNEAVVRR